MIALQMIDCAGNGNFGCEGGDICSLLTWLVNNKISILPENEYPITGQSAACKLDKYFLLSRHFN